MFYQTVQNTLIKETLPRECEVRSASNQIGDESEMDFSQLVLQADENVARNTTTSQTAVFVDKDVGNVVKYDSLPSLTTNDMQDSVDLQNYLSRPTLISTISWTTSTLADTVLDPWTLLLDNTFVKYKLNNFAFLRGSLNIKIVVNAAPFYYGSAIAAYTPLFNYMPSIPAYTGNNKITWSQRPHVWIYPQSNTGGEIVVPFIWPLNYLHVSDSNAIADMGRLHIFKYLDLASANGASTNGCTIQVYAWLDNVELKIPTVGLALQGDEYSDSPISRPASAVSNVASWFEGIPIIGTFATATRLGASAVSSIAALFGWSNPPIIENVKPFKSLPFHDLASASLSEPTSKITLDPKAELSVDPRIVGLDGKDELAISNIVTIESYLAQYTWNCSDAIGTLLFASQVIPTIQGVYDATTHYQINATPMSMVSNMFQNWRGDIIFRFVIVASQYHRGRLRITWDPYNSITATTDYSNIAFTKIVDLGETTETEIRVPYAQAFPWLSCNASYTTEKYGSSYVAPDVGATNGTLTVRVLTNLSAPIDVAPVTIQVFVKGAENLEFANPRDVDRRLQHFEMQSDNYTEADQVEQRIQDKDSDPMQPSIVHPERYLVNWGEAIPSLRILLRRSTLVDCKYIGSAITASWLERVTSLMGRRPPSPGFDPNAYTEVDATIDVGTDYPYNIVRHSPLSYISPMFVCSRGAIRWHFQTYSQGQISRRFMVQRNINELTANSVDLHATASGLVGNVGYESSSTHSATFADDTPTWSGAVLTDPTVQPSLTCEMSMMSPYKFSLTNPEYSLIGTQFDGSLFDTYSLTIDLEGTTTGYAKSFLDRWVSAGTDFNLHCFLCAPVMYYNATVGNAPKTT